MTITPALTPADPNTIEFASILIFADWLTEANDVLDFFEKPHKWDREHQAWTAAGMPGPQDRGWEAFCATLEHDQDDHAG